MLVDQNIIDSKGKPTLYAYAHKHISGTLSLLPTELGGGVCFTLDEVISQNRDYAAFYEKTISCLAPVLSEYLGITKYSSSALARVVGIPISHFWIDRLVRFLRLLENHTFSVACAPQLQPVKTIDEFNSLVTNSSNWNQGLLCHFAQVFQLQISACEFILPEPSTKNAPGYVNHMFDLPRRSFRDRVMRRFRSELSKQFGYIPAMHMAYSKAPLLDNRLYGFGLLRNISPKIAYVLPEPDLSIRRYYLGRFAEELRPHLLSLLRVFNVPVSSINRAIDGFAEYLCQTYPTSLLEGAKDNFRLWERVLKRFKGRPLISSGVSFSTESAFSIAAARSLEMKVIGCQHGGYQGYMSWQTSALEGEHALCGKFITWGWVQKEDHSASKHVQMIPLPAPWLSEKQKYWSPYLDRFLSTARLAEFDMLFMPNKVNPFPPAPTGIQATLNDIQSYAKFLYAFMESAGEHNVSVLHKPHNQTTLDLLPVTHQEIYNSHGYLYNLDKKLHKGLSLELLDKCRIVVWEQPGTGFVECLVSGIPSMIIWTRSYNREPQWVEPLFKELEISGIIHRSFATLFQEYFAFKIDPNAWMKETRRVNTIKKFCQQYAWACDNWPSHWKRFIKEARHDAEKSLLM